MIIQWLGHACFKISVKTGNTEVIVVTDPYSNEVGLRLPRLTADIVTVSHDHFDHNNFQDIKGSLEAAPFIIKEAGEYETKGVFVQGIPTFHDNKAGAERGKNLAYVIHADDVTILHLGDIGHQLANEQLEAIGDVDILLIPIGGKYTIDAKEAFDIVKVIEPRMVIPMHYKSPGIRVDVAGVEPFVKFFGSKVEQMKKLKVAKKDLVGEDTKVIVLERE